MRGSPVFLRGFLEDLHVQSLLGHHLLQPRIFFLKGLQLLGHLRLHAAALLTLAVIRLLGNLQLLADFQDFFPLTEFHVDATKSGDYLVYTVTFL